MFPLSVRKVGGGGGKVKNLWAVACAVMMMGGPVLAWGADGQLADNAINIQQLPPQSKDLPPKNALPPAANSNYRIGPEDVLYISVWESKELSLEVVVRPDGMISFPLVQDVVAEGLTAVELADVLHQKLLVYLKEPQVSVILKQVNAPKVFILGNVARPGTYPLRSDMSVLQALSLAGGFTQFASPRNIRIVRGAGHRQVVRTVNYYKMIDSDAEGNYLLRPGDTIVVP
jgi:polysaccharide export outer membrane protein